MEFLQTAHFAGDFGSCLRQGSVTVPQRRLPVPLHSWHVCPSLVFPFPLQAGQRVGGFGPCSMPIVCLHSSWRVG